MYGYFGYGFGYSGYYGCYGSLSAALALCAAYALLANPIYGTAPSAAAPPPLTSTPCWLATPPS